MAAGFDLVALCALLALGVFAVSLAAAAMVILGLLPLDDAYANLEGPVLVLIAMIYIVTMLVSNVTNYVATAVLMAPIAHSVATGLGMALDPFLMAVAYGSVSAFMTPIGHTSNTLVMGPGGYKFSDYARMGVPLSILTTITAALLIPYFWPLHG